MIEEARDMQPSDLQALYNRLGTTRAVATYLKMSTARVSRFLHDNGVEVNKSHGGRSFKVDAPKPVVRNLAPPVLTRRKCNEPHLPRPLSCTHYDLPNACSLCRYRHTAVRGLQSAATLCEEEDE